MQTMPSSALAECMEAKVPNLELSRWFGYMDHITELTTGWHGRLLSIIFKGVQLGVDRDPVDCQLVSGLAASRSLPEEEGGESNSRDRGQPPSSQGTQAGLRAMPPEKIRAGRWLPAETWGLYISGA